MLNKLKNNYLNQNLFRKTAFCEYFTEFNDKLKKQPFKSKLI